MWVSQKCTATVTCCSFCLHWIFDCLYHPEFLTTFISLYQASGRLEKWKTPVWLACLPAWLGQMPRRRFPLVLSCSQQVSTLTARPLSVARLGSSCSETRTPGTGRRFACCLASRSCHPHHTATQRETCLPARRLWIVWTVEKVDPEPEVAEAPRQRQRRRLRFTGGLAAETWGRRS